MGPTSKKINSEDISPDKMSSNLDGSDDHHVGPIVGYTNPAQRKRASRTKATAWWKTHI